MARDAPAGRYKSDRLLDFEAFLAGHEIAPALGRNDHGIFYANPPYVWIVESRLYRNDVPGLQTAVIDAYRRRFVYRQTHAVSRAVNKSLRPTLHDFGLKPTPLDFCHGSAVNGRTFYAGLYVTQRGPMCGLNNTIHTLQFRRSLPLQNGPRKIPPIPVRKMLWKDVNNYRFSRSERSLSLLMRVRALHTAGRDYITAKRILFEQCARDGHPQSLGC